MSGGTAQQRWHLEWHQQRNGEARWLSMDSGEGSRIGELAANFDIVPE
jgi:hypothetical protein